MGVGGGLGGCAAGGAATQVFPRRVELAQHRHIPDATTCGADQTTPASRSCLCDAMNPCGSVRCDRQNRRQQRADRTREREVG